MLSLLKKKSEAAAAPAVPPWHPNFRNYEKLPDIKVVRTAFFVNMAAISVALALAVYFGFHEWKLRVYRGQIAEQVRFITRDKPASDQAVALFKKFQAEEAKIIEVETFVKSKPPLSNLIAHLGSTMPAAVALDSFDLREGGLSMRLSVRGAPDVASGHATAYRDQLAADKKLMEYFAEPAIANLAQNPATGRLALEINLPIRGAKK
jgi:hypothetical protein